MQNKLYTTFPGRLFLKIMTLPAVSKAAGSFMNSSFSKLMINPFIKHNKIDMSDFKTENWKSFNEFFTRKLRPGKREINDNPAFLISPCDGYLTSYDISLDSKYEIKNSIYSLSELLKDENLSYEYSGGKCIVIRLTPSDYHRYVYPDSGCKGKNIHIPGIFHTVRPVAFEKYPVFNTNTREYTILRTNNFDDLIFMEVGAMLVGKIDNYHEEYNFTKGEEKGKFLFGGSTIIMILKKGTAIIDGEIIKQNNEGKEFKVRMGQKIGIRL